MQYLIPPILLAAVLASGAAHAQGGAPGAPAAPPRGISGQVALGYLATSGNTNSTNANASFGLLYALTHWKHQFDLSAVSATNDDVKTAEAYSAKYQGRRTFGDDGKTYLFASLDWAEDRFSAYDRQVSETAGYGRRLLARGPHELDGEIGAGARQSTARDGTDERDGIVRGAVHYALAFGEMTGFKQDLVVESGSTNTSTESVSALKARLVGKIGLVLSYRIKHNSDVPPGTEPTDRFTSISLEYSF